MEVGTPFEVFQAINNPNSPYHQNNVINDGTPINTLLRSSISVKKEFNSYFSMCGVPAKSEEIDSNLAFPLYFTMNSAVKVFGCDTKAKGRIIVGIYNEIIAKIRKDPVYFNYYRDIFNFLFTVLAYHNGDSVTIH